MTAAPDLAEPVVGWRVWHLAETPDGLRLHAIGRSVIWQPLVELDAVCLCRRTWRPLRRPISRHVAPAADCTCGIWACRTLAGALAALDLYGRPWGPVHRVVGRVSLWGVVVEHDRGWRAAHGYPVEIVVPTRRLHGALAPDVDRAVTELRAYAVPVTTVDGGSRPQLRRSLGQTPADTLGQT